MTATPRQAKLAGCLQSAGIVGSLTSTHQIFQKLLCRASGFWRSSWPGLNPLIHWLSGLCSFNRTADPVDAWDSRLPTATEGFWCQSDRRQQSGWRTLQFYAFEVAFN
jgi:hypothetical protein